jgi:iron-sulfur cluster repair protein YtfE (RIC family)
MNTHTDSARIAETLSHKWREEHTALDAFFDDFRKWAYEVAQRGVPRFGETAGKLKQLRQRLVTHFEREDGLSTQFVALRGGLSPEPEANRRMVTHDHASLLTQLDSLIEKLNELEPPFASWQEAIEQVERFIDVLDQHEEQESDSIAWLLPEPG